LLRIEEHFTAQVQNQQARITTSLTVSGFMLAFLANAAFTQARTPFWTSSVLVVALATFAISLLAGVVALFPRIPVRQSRGTTEPSAEASLHGRFVDTQWFQTEGPRMPKQALLRVLSQSIYNEQHAKTLQFRRNLLRLQLADTAVAIVLLVVATSGRLLS
jgi:hypothetical protein